MPKEALAGATGILRRRAQSDVTAPDPEIEASRARQAEIQTKLNAAIKKGDKTLQKIHEDALAAEMQSRARRHKTTIRVPSYQKGGTVKETGLAMIHEGEKISPAGARGVSKAMGGAPSAPAAAETPMTMGSDVVPEQVEEMRLRPNDDGSFYVEIDFVSPEGKKGKGRPKRFSMADPAALHAAIDEYFGAAESEEEEETTEAAEELAEGEEPEKEEPEEVEVEIPEETATPGAEELPVG